MEAKTVDEEFDYQARGKEGRPKKKPLFAVPVPANESQERHNPIERGKSELELLAAQPLIIEIAASLCDALRAADQGHCFKPTSFARVGGEERRLPDANCKD